MMCVKPYLQGMAAYGCGQCIPCRINRKRQWTHRIILESKLCEHNSFITLTHDDATLNYKNSKTGAELPLPTLSPEDLRNFLKRFRDRIKPRRVRYFAVGEYGDESQRPHYHLAMFGYRGCHARRTVSNWGRNCDCIDCGPIAAAWDKGIIQNGPLMPEGAAYIAGYVTKKMTADDDQRLLGRYPEFARMSSMPGIGYNALHEIADVLMKHGLDETMHDVPHELRHGSKLMPLDSYLRRKLRLLIGKPITASEEAKAEAVKELLPLYEGAKANTGPSAVQNVMVRNLYAEAIEKAFAGRRHRQAFRMSLKQNGKKL